MNLDYICAYCDKPVATTITPEGFFQVLDGCECLTKNNKLCE